MNHLFEYPNVLWLGLVLVVLLVLVHFIALRMIGQYFRKKYPEAYQIEKQDTLTEPLETAESEKPTK